MAYDALCFRCNQLPRTSIGSFGIHGISSPLHWSRQIEYPWAVLESELDKSHRVLEISGSHSILKFALAKRCRHVVDTEYDKDYMSVVQETIDSQCAIWGMDNITQVWSDLRNLPYPDNWFDRVFCISVLEHVPEDHWKGVQELVRVLKPGGILMLSMDVVFEGIPGSCDNFYCDLKIACDLAGNLGINKILTDQHGNPPYVVRIDYENVTLGALLIKYYKPEKEVLILT
jgi:SAM-dependent methyltransferase